jgi:hypothetical protein
MAQQTAVEWLISQLYISEDSIWFKEIREQAKEMEKQQREISQMDMFYYINNRNFGDGYIQRRDEAKKYIEQYTTKNI